MHYGSALKPEQVKTGLRVYDRYSDLFGSITSAEIADGFVLVKYEWPYDPNALPCLVKVERLMLASLAGCDMSTLRLGSRGEQLIKSFEQLRLTAYRPTRDDVLTIGWGSTSDVHEGLSITIDQAQLRFMDDVSSAVKAVNALPCALTQSMFDALVSLVFNVGPSAIKPGSTIGKALLVHGSINPARYFDAWSGFALWRKQAGKDLLGLARRRAKEMDLFLADGLP